MIRLLPYIFFIYEAVAVAISFFFIKGHIANSLCKAFAFLLFFFTIYQSAKEKKFFFSYFIPIILYFTTQIINISFRFDSSFFIDFIVQFLFLCAVLLYIPCISTNIWICKNILMLQVFFVICSSFYCFFCNFSFILNLSFLSQTNYRMVGFFDNKNTFGMMLFSALVSTFYMKALSPYKKIHTITFFFLLFTICISLSRTSLFMSILFIFLVFSFRIRKQKKYQKYIFIFFSSIIAIFAFDNPIKNYVINILIRPDVGSFREPIYEGCRMLIQASPICGYGENAFGSRLNVIVGNFYPHNGYYAQLLSGGLIQFIVYTFILGIAIKNAFLLQKKDTNLGSIAIASIICSCIYATSENVIIMGASVTNLSFCLINFIIPIFLLHTHEHKYEIYQNVDNK